MWILSLVQLVILYFTRVDHKRIVGIREWNEKESSVCLCEKIKGLDGINLALNGNLTKPKTNCISTDSKS